VIGELLTEDSSAIGTVAGVTPGISEGGVSQVGWVGGSESHTPAPGTIQKPLLPSFAEKKKKKKKKK
jgi:hypothetical protein